MPIFIATLWFAAFLGSPSAALAAARQPPAVLEAHSLLNLAIDFRSIPTQIGEDNIVRLNNGVWRDLEDAGFEFTLAGRSARGDLDGDGAEDVVIIIKQGMATDAEHYWLVAVLNRGGKPAPLAPPVMIGDGVTIDKLEITNGVIRAEVIEGRIEQYAGRVRFALHVVNDRLVAVQK
jgi:hypothetical protein